MSKLDKFTYGVCVPVVVVGLGYASCELYDQFQGMKADMIAQEYEIEINKTVYVQRLAVSAALKLFWESGDAGGDALDQSSLVVKLKGEINDNVIDALRFELLGGEELPDYGDCSYGQFVSLTADWTAFRTDLPDFIKISRNIFGSNEVDEKLIEGKAPKVSLVCDNSLADLNSVASFSKANPFKIEVTLIYHGLDFCGRQGALAHEFGHMFFDVDDQKHDLGKDEIYRLGNRFGDKCRQSPK